MSDSQWVQECRRASVYEFYHIRCADVRLRQSVAWRRPPNNFRNFSHNFERINWSEFIQIQGIEVSISMCLRVLPCPVKFLSDFLGEKWRITGDLKRNLRNENKTRHRTHTTLCYHVGHVHATWEVDSAPLV